MTGLVTDQPMQVALWAAKRMGGHVLPPLYAVGHRGRQQEPVGAFIWSEMSDHNIELTVYAPQCLTKDVIKQSFAYAFNALGVARITVRCRSDRPELMKMIERFGWLREGTMRRFYGDDADVCYLWNGCEATVGGYRK